MFHWFGPVIFIFIILLTTFIQIKMPIDKRMHNVSVLQEHCSLVLLPSHMYILIQHFHYLLNLIIEFCWSRSYSVLLFCNNYKRSFSQYRVSWKYHSISWSYYPPSNSKLYHTGISSNSLKNYNNKQQPQITKNSR